MMPNGPFQIFLQMSYTLEKFKDTLNNMLYISKICFITKPINSPVVEGKIKAVV